MTKTTTRNDQLREILLARQRDLEADVQRRIREGRTDRTTEVRDELEDSDANISEDVSFALLQMQAETLRRIKEALERLEAGEYGSCFQCGAEISETRLLALPFAVRCKACEERRERFQAETRRLTNQNVSVSLFSNVASS